jgi:hypothetical protein
MVLADLEIERTPRRGGQWWDYHSRPEIERDPEWAPLGVADQTATQRLARGTRLRRVATTDRMWDVLYNPGTPVFENLYEILDGPLAGGQLVAVRFGPSDIEVGLAGKMVVQDHPPAWDPGVAELRLSAAAAAVEQALRLESTGR